MSRIARFEVGRFDYDLMGEFKFFKTPVRPSIVMRLTDENGVQGLNTPAALNGPQYSSAGGTTDPTFRANGDAIRVPAAPGLGITLDDRAEKSMSMAAKAG
jgi:hypothetical protein